MRSALTLMIPLLFTACEGESGGPPSDELPCVEGWTAGICQGEAAGEDCADFPEDVVETYANNWSQAMADLCGNQYTFDAEESGAQDTFVECFLVGYDEAYAEAAVSCE